MPQNLGNITDRLARKQFKLTNKVGGMGRYGIRGPVERLEDKKKNREKYIKNKQRIAGL